MCIIADSTTFSCFSLFFSFFFFFVGGRGWKGRVLESKYHQVACTLQQAPTSNFTNGVTLRREVLTLDQTLKLHPFLLLTVRSASSPELNFILKHALHAIVKSLRITTALLQRTGPKPFQSHLLLNGTLKDQAGLHCRKSSPPAADYSESPADFDPVSSPFVLPARPRLSAVIKKLANRLSQRIIHESGGRSV